MGRKPHPNYLDGSIQSPKDLIPDVFGSVIRYLGESDGLAQIPSLFGDQIEDIVDLPLFDVLIEPVIVTTVVDILADACHAVLCPLCKKAFWF